VKDTDIIAAIAPDAVSLMDKAIAEIKRLRQENATLTAERDEARRMYCGRVSRDVQPDAFEIAKNHGWDCFPQEDGK
jgi:hypothetical protein